MVKNATLFFIAAFAPVIMMTGLANLGAGMFLGVMILIIAMFINDSNEGM